MTPQWEESRKHFGDMVPMGSRTLAWLPVTAKRVHAQWEWKWRLLACVLGTGMLLFICIWTVLSAAILCHRTSWIVYYSEAVFSHLTDTRWMGFLSSFCMQDEARGSFWFGFGFRGYFLIDLFSSFPLAALYFVFFSPNVSQDAAVKGNG